MNFCLLHVKVGVKKNQNLLFYMLVIVVQNNFLSDSVNCKFIYLQDQYFTL